MNLIKDPVLNAPSSLHRPEACGSNRPCTAWHGRRNVEVGDEEDAHGATAHLRGADGGDALPLVYSLCCPGRLVSPTPL